MRQGQAATLPSAPWLAVFGLWAVAGGLAGCCRAQEPAPVRPRPEPAAHGLSPRDLACREDRLIAIKKAPRADCPAVTGWEVRHLFAADPDHFVDRESVPPDLPSSLAKYCVYRRPSAAPGPAGLPPGHPSLHPDLAAVDRECAAVTAAGTVEEATWQDLAQQFARVAGGFDGAPPPPATPPIRLAVLDTFPSRTEGVFWCTEEDCSLHGPSLLHFAWHLACPPGTGTCPISSRLALPQVYSGGGTYEAGSEGGHFGTFEDLARALHAEAAIPGPVVLNLSLGWDPLYQATDEAVDAGAVRLATAAGRTGAQAVRDAMEYAVCRGALPIAAAGNALWGPGGSTVEPIYPAAWEAEPAPTARRCKAARIPPAKVLTKASATSYRPLVYAVAGVQADRRPLANARQQAPRLAAYGDHAVVPRGPAGHTGLLTGSSVAVAVVAAAAARRWGNDPTQSPFEVMDALYDSGVPTGRGAGLCLGSPPLCPEVRFVTLCTALGGSCLAGTSPAVLEKPSGDEGSTPLMGELELVAAAENPRDLFQDVRAVTYMIPQPDSDPCPPCQLLRSETTLLLDLSFPAIPLGVEFTMAELTLSVREGDAAQHYRLLPDPNLGAPLGELVKPGGDPVTVVVPADMLPEGDLYPITISLKLIPTDDAMPARSVTVPVLVASGAG